MEDLSTALFYDTVPDSWVARAYPSMMGLAAWYADLLLRIRVSAGLPALRHPPERAVAGPGRKREQLPPTPSREPGSGRAAAAKASCGSPVFPSVRPVPLGPGVPPPHVNRSQTGSQGPATSRHPRDLPTPARRS